MHQFGRLCAIVDVEVARRAGWAPLDLAAAYVNGGARFLQVRAKSLGGAAFLDLATRVRELAHTAAAAVIVNDRADIARLSGADGLHVGQDDLAPAAARTIVGPDALLGLSTHTEQQVAQALLEPITYVAIGPVFESSTKAGHAAVVGLAGVTRAAERAAARGLDLVAIGGITLERAGDVIEAGATAVAVVGDLLSGGDPEARVRAFVERLGREGKV